MVPPCGTPTRVPGPRARWAGADRPPHGAPHDRHHLVHVGLPLPGLDGVRQAAVDVVLQQQERDLVGGGGHRLDLLQDVQAVGLVLDQALRGRGPGPRSGAAGSAARGGPWCTRAGSARVPVCGRHTRGQYADARRPVNQRVPCAKPMPDLEREELIAPLDRALVIFSHPDDAEFSAAPTIAALTAAGARVDYVVTTDGGKGTEDPAVTPAQLAATRDGRAARGGGRARRRRDRAPRLSGRLPARRAWTCDATSCARSGASGRTW